MRASSTLIAALVLSALVPSAATAEDSWHFASTADHTVVTGALHAGNDQLSFDAGNVTCSHITYAGTFESGTTTTTELSLTPTYTPCSAFGFVNVPMHSNGCTYGFASATFTSGSYEADDVAIKCPAGKTIEITAPGCTVTIGQQTVAGGATTFTNKGSGNTSELTVDIALEGITYEEHNKGIFPTCGSNTEATSNGTYTGSATLTGETGAGAHVGIEVESTDEPTEEPVHSEIDHTFVTGSQVATNVFTFGVLIGAVECEVATFDGTLAAKTATSLTIKPAYSKCVGIEREVTTHMNGCAYVLTATGEGADGPVDIECPVGQVIETTVDAFPGGCTITIGAQTPGGTVDYKGEGSGSTRDLLLTWTLEGIKYKRDGCEVGGEGNNGTYAGSATLKGENGSGQQKGIWVE